LHSKKPDDEPVFFALRSAAFRQYLRLYAWGRFSARNPYQNGGITMLKYKVALLLALIAAPTIFVTGQQRPTPIPAPQPLPP